VRPIENLFPLEAVSNRDRVVCFDYDFEIMISVANSQQHFLFTWIRFKIDEAKQSQ